MKSSERGQYEQFVIGAISILSNRFNRFADSLHSDITFKQWYLMMMISRMEDEPRNVRDIAEFTGTTRQNVKKMLSSLEDKGYVRCSRSSADGRALDVDLTRKAHTYLDQNGAEAERKTTSSSRACRMPSSSTSSRTSRSSPIASMPSRRNSEGAAVPSPYSSSSPTSRR